MPNVERPVARTTGTPASTTRATASCTPGLIVSSTTPLPCAAWKIVPSMSSATTWGRQDGFEARLAPRTSTNGDRLEDLATLQVGTQRLGHADRPVGLLVGLEDRDDR